MGASQSVRFAHNRIKKKIRQNNATELIIVQHFCFALLVAKEEHEMNIEHVAHACSMFACRCDDPLAHLLIRIFTFIL